ncbi:MAG: shikimate dehydrogenase [Mariprofundaceae bacterium]|nr:shikimate dehydrogenase [Mariprofundaceae bacterium]
MKLTGKTHVYGIIGNPVSHSLSPMFQAYFAEKYRVDAVYVPFSVSDEGLQVALDGLREASIQGLNITVPFKESVLPYVCMDDDVRCIGAANTLQSQGGKWHAYNTDWQGIAAVMKGSGLDFQEQSILLFGAGGTARAALHAAAMMGVTRVWVCNRSVERRDALLHHARKAYPKMLCEAVDWHQAAVDKASMDACLMMNTTSIGLSDHQVFPFYLQGSGWAMDAVYRADGETAFVCAARQAGRDVVDGLPMLVAQGVQSFEIWHPECELDILDALHWMTGELNRVPFNFPGWEGVHET